MPRRRLPHVYPEGRALFLTWHVHGSLPASRYPPPGSRNAGRAFVWMDRYLDTTRNGPLWLKNPEIARLVRDSIHHGSQQLGYYDWEAYVVMANHVHLLAWPKVPPPKLLGSLKSYTGREANRLLARTGEPFWQKESYDHWVRNNDELQRIVAYIEQNPVKAGLVTKPEDYPWSSAAARVAGFAAD